MQILLFSTILCISLISLGQQNKCKSHTRWVKMAEQNPNMSIKRTQLENVTKKYEEDIETGRRKKTDDVITIPVVVHVIYNQEIENISNEQIQSQIDVLNNDFNNNNSDAITVEDEDFAFYAEFSLGSNIRFELAKHTPNGSATTGITRTQTSIEGFDENLTNIYSTSDGGKDNWEPTKYLNIWVIALQESSMTLGWAQFPSDLSEYPASDGVVIRHEVFGTTGTAGSGDWSANGLGRTGTHEVGHWLNLKHTWGDLADDDQTCGSDLVSDTPPVQIANYGCPIGTHNENSSCGTDSRGEMYMNYMDYVNDKCMILFSEGQVTRMRAALDGARNGLLTSGGITSITPSAVLDGVAIYPNPSNSAEFSIDLASQIESIKVSDSYGRVIIERYRSASNYKLDLSSYPHGIYYLTITSDGFSSTQKIITQ